jgi:hypothetical protein
MTVHPHSLISVSIRMLDVSGRRNNIERSEVCLLTTVAEYRAEGWVACVGIRE